MARSACLVFLAHLEKCKMVVLMVRFLPQSWGMICRPNFVQNPNASGWQQAPQVQVQVLGSKNGQICQLKKSYQTFLVAPAWGKMASNAQFFIIHRQNGPQDNTWRKVGKSRLCAPPTAFNAFLATASGAQPTGQKLIKSSATTTEF